LDLFPSFSEYGVVIVLNFPGSLEGIVLHFLPEASEEIMYLKVISNFFKDSNFEKPTFHAVNVG